MKEADEMKLHLKHKKHVKSMSSGEENCSEFTDVASSYCDKLGSSYLPTPTYA